MRLCRFAGHAAGERDSEILINPLSIYKVTEVASGFANEGTCRLYVLGGPNYGIGVYQSMSEVAEEWASAMSGENEVPRLGLE